MTCFNSLLAFKRYWTNTKYWQTFSSSVPLTMILITNFSKRYKLNKTELQFYYVNFLSQNKTLAFELSQLNHVHMKNIFASYFKILSGVEKNWKNQTCDRKMDSYNQKLGKIKYSHATACLHSRNYVFSQHKYHNGTGHLLDTASTIHNFKLLRNRI